MVVMQSSRLRPLPSTSARVEQQRRRAMHTVRSSEADTCVGLGSAACELCPVMPTLSIIASSFTERSLINKLLIFRDKHAGIFQRRSLTFSGLLAEIAVDLIIQW